MSRPGLQDTFERCSRRSAALARCESGQALVENVIVLTVFSIACITATRYIVGVMTQQLNTQQTGFMQQAQTPGTTWSGSEGGTLGGTQYCGPGFSCP